MALASQLFPLRENLKSLRSCAKVRKMDLESISIATITLVGNLSIF